MAQTSPSRPPPAFPPHRVDALARGEPVTVGVVGGAFGANAYATLLQAQIERLKRL